MPQDRRLGASDTRQEVKVFSSNVIERQEATAVLLF